MNIKKKDAIDTIENYIDVLNSSGHLYFNKERFAQHSYSVWAAKEILENVKESDLDPILVMEDFLYKVDTFSWSNNRNSYIFSVAKDICLDILDRFYVR